MKPDENLYLKCAEKIIDTSCPRCRELENLLCRIHRDGGHYIQAHGMEKACADADKVLIEQSIKCDIELDKVSEIQQHCRELEKERDEFASAIIEALAISKPGSVSLPEYVSGLRQDRDKLASGNQILTRGYNELLESSARVEAERDSLRQQLKTLRKALEPFIKYFEESRTRRGKAAAEWFEKMPGHWPFQFDRLEVTMDHMRAAKSALQATEGK